MRDRTCTYQTSKLKVFHHSLHLLDLSLLSKNNVNMQIINNTDLYLTRTVLELPPRAFFKSFVSTESRKGTVQYIVMHS